MKKKPSKEIYTCVGCDFYDQLEHYAVLRKQLHLFYMDEENRLVETHIQIKDFQTADKMEFLITEKGQYIRLDKIQSVQELA